LYVSPDIAAPDTDEIEYSNQALLEPLSQDDTINLAPFTEEPPWIFKHNAVLCFG